MALKELSLAKLWCVLPVHTVRILINFPILFIDKDTKEKKRYKFCFPRLEGQFVGTGDTFTSLLVVWLTELNGDVAETVKHVLESMQEVLKKTSQFAQSAFLCCFANF